MDYAIDLLQFFNSYIDAQKRDQVHFGMKVGANYSNVYDIKGQDFTADYKWGMAGGIFVSIPLGDVNKPTL